MRRRLFLLLAITTPTVLRAAEPAATARGAVASLEERLTAGLKVRAPADVAFCERVAALVRAGELPVQLVDSTYLWAVRRGRKYPFPAFERALRLKAEKLGVTL